MNRADLPIRSIQRLIRRVELGDGGCWLWQGAYNSKGYPTTTIGGKTYYCHRIAHILFIGPIPPGLQIHHKCVNRGCINPDHLVPVSEAENRVMQRYGIGEIPVDAEDDVPF